MKKFNLKLVALSLALVLCASVLAACGGGGDTVTVGSKQFTESILVGEMLAQLVEAKTDLKVERKLNLGGTTVVALAIQNQEIDFYLEYSGTAYNELLKLTREAGMTPDDVYEAAKKGLNEQLGITALDPIGMNNAFAIAVTREYAESKGVQTISDLAAISGEVRFGANHMFFPREYDGYDDMVATYGMNFKETLKMDTSLLYDAIDKGELDAMVVYATDAMLAKLDMVVLEDDKNFFPPYYGMPIVNNKTLEAHPELKEALNSLAGLIDDAQMQKLNNEVDGNNRTVEEVAKEFLTRNGLI